MERPEQLRPFLWPVARRGLIFVSGKEPRKPIDKESFFRERCSFCGRARAVYRKFGICRICLRERAHLGEIPGMRKASW